MKQSFVSFLKKHTWIYGIIRRIYRGFMSKFGSIFGTRFEERKWANQNSQSVGGSSDINHPHRKFLLDEISLFSPIKNALEVGCGEGSNLYLLSRKFPKAELTGVDINHNSIENGINWLRKEGIDNVKLSVGKADELNEFADKSFDVVITDAVLMYIGPDKIRKVIQEMIRISRHALFFVEWNFFDSNNSLGVYERHWIRNYAKLMTEFIPEKNIQVFKLPEKAGFEDELWKKWGALVVVKIK